MRTKEIKLYKFNELNKEAQEKAITNNYDINSSDDWYEPELEMFAEDAKKIGFDIEPGEIEFDLDRGANFGIRPDGISVIDEYIKKELGLKTKPWVDIKFNVRKIGMQHQEFPHDRWFHSNENSRGWYEVIDKRGKPYGDKIKKLCDTMIDKLCDLCAEYFKRIQDSYEGAMSEDAIKETLIANDYEFTEEGDMA